MRGPWLLLALWLAACGRESDEPSAAPSQPAILAAPAQVSKLPTVAPLPKDRAQLDRMIIAGYTPHGDHLHAPGVEQCPMAKGAEAVL